MIMKKRITIEKVGECELLLHTYNGAQDASSCTEIYDDVFNLGLRNGQHADIYFDLENGTFEVIKQREDGFYWAKKNGYNSRGIVQLKGGEYLDIDGAALTVDLSKFDISNVRIPDECVI